MNFRILQAVNHFRHSLSARSILLFGLFGQGLFCGIVAISLWEQWSLTFGLDPLLVLAASLVLSFSFSWRPSQWRLQSASTARLPTYLILCLCAWSVVHPYWIETITLLLARIPLSEFEQAATKPLLALMIASVIWAIPGILWSSVIACGASAAKRAGLSVRQALAVILSGITVGLLLNSLLIAPRFGVFLPTLLTAMIAAVVGLRLYRSAGHDDPVIDVAQTPESSNSVSALTIRWTMACLVGGLLACNLRIVNQLMPHGSFVIYVQLAGLLAGLVTGLTASKWLAPDNRASWGGLFAAASASLLLAIQPTLVDASLWMNSSLTSVQLLLACRILILMAIAFPFGVALAWIADISKDHAPALVGKPLTATPLPTTEAMVPEPGRTELELVAWGMPLGIGISVTVFVIGGIAGLMSVMTVCAGLLIVGAGLLRVSTSGWRMSFRTAVGMGCLALAALSMPRWYGCDDVSRTAKLLFSTPAVLAYRYGWDIKYLPFLDDVRMIDRREGSTGPLTLWRGRVAELYVRESGFPRAVMTKDSNAVPQFAPEVLQAVYSMVFCERPERVLFLGLSGGAPVSTCLNFPIREAVCVEGDPNLIALIQGPLAREIGFDPLTDDRVTIRRVTPELAMLARPDKPFDVIMSSPPPSSLSHGSAQFTQEFYQHVSHHLADRGLFCQRFECIDYGVTPIQLVVKAMRGAFKQVIAIEPAAGELLLFAANSEDVFVPVELATRLEMSHVSRILAHSGMDWSALLNLPAFDHAALGEFCDDSPRFANSTFKGQLASMAPLEIMRWGNKQQEVQEALTSTRVTPAPFWSTISSRLKQSGEELHLSRRSRLVEWLGDAKVSQELLRRLGEIVEQQKLVRENPDAHWWAYRRALKKQLQERPRAAIQQVNAIGDKQALHPEDLRRRDYFVALGNAARREKPTRKQIAAVEEFLEPYDPLVSYFARQETADLLARCGEDVGHELAYRLHVIFFAPTVDASVRNVAKAVETLVKHPEAIPDDSTRFDALNGLIQTLRVRWELRQTLRETSTKKILDDIDQSLLAIENGLETMDALVMTAGVPDSEWRPRKEVIERLMLRPLRAYRDEMHARHVRGQNEVKAIIEEANRPVAEEPIPDNID